MEGRGRGGGEGQDGRARGRARGQEIDFVPVRKAETTSGRLGRCSARQVERMVSRGKQKFVKGVRRGGRETKASKRWMAGTALEVRRGGHVSGAVIESLVSMRLRQLRGGGGRVVSAPRRCMRLSRVGGQDQRAAALTRGIQADVEVEGAESGRHSGGSRFVGFG